MKNPYRAFILSVLILGAGLAYLRKWKWAAWNFGLFVVVVFAIPMLLALILPTAPTYPQVIGLPLAVLSGVVAFWLCRREMVSQGSRKNGVRV